MEVHCGLADYQPTYTGPSMHDARRRHLRCNGPIIPLKIPRERDIFTGMKQTDAARPGLAWPVTGYCEVRGNLAVVAELGSLPLLRTPGALFAPPFATKQRDLSLKSKPRKMDGAIVRIRELKKDSVNFVLENVDMAYAHGTEHLKRRLQSHTGSPTR